MKKLTARGRIALALGVAGIVATVATLRFHRAPLSALDEEIAALDQEAAGLKDSDEGAARVARAQISGLTASLWDEARFEAWKGKLNRAWAVTTLETLHRPNVTLRKVALQRRETPFEDWPDLLTTIETLSRQPSVSIVSMNLTSAPPPGRILTQCLVVVTFAFPSPGHPPAAATPAAPTAPAASSPPPSSTSTTST